MTLTSPSRSHNLDAQIYVACLAAYNNGILHGAWIDAVQDADAIRSEIAAMLATSPIPHSEEYAIHDYEGFEGIRIEEYTGVDRIANIAEFLCEHGRLGAAVASCFGDDLDEARRAMDERYQGCFKSLADFAQQITEETTTIPQQLAFYVDWDKMAHDMKISGDVLTIESAFDEVHVFWAG